MNLTKARVIRRIARLKSNLAQYEIENPSRRFNFFGGESYGFIKGQISILEEILDDMEQAGI